MLSKIPNEQKPFYLLTTAIAVFALIDLGGITPTNLSAVSTVVVAIFTVFLVFETRFLRKQNYLQSIKPNMDIYVVKRDFQPDAYNKCVDIVVINNGPGMACKIALDFKNKSTGRLGEEAFEYVKGKLDKEFSRKDLSYLSVGHPQCYFLNLAEDDRAYEKILVEYRAEVIMTYQDVDKHRYTGNFIIDFSDHLR